MRVIKYFKSNKHVKKFTGDVFFNIVAFSIYIIGQQILLLPILARNTNDKGFSSIVVFISIFSIITNTLGSELGVTRQIKKEDDENKGIDQDGYDRFILYLTPIVIIVAVTLLSIYNFNLKYIIVCTIVIVLGNFRLYLAAFFRLQKNFIRVILQNVAYVVGMLIGLGIFLLTENFFLPFIVAEVCGVGYSLKKIPFRKKRKFRWQQFKLDVSRIGKTFFDLGLIALLINTMVYFDRLIIYPILGATAVSVYYAANSMSKAVTLIVNPIHGVILSWLGSSKNYNKQRILKITIKLNFPMVIIAAIVSWPITYFALWFLYPQYFEQALSFIVPICISVGFSVACSLSKGVLLKFINSRKLLTCYISYFIIFAILAMPLSSMYGIMGFVIANLVARIEQWVVFMVFMKNALSKGESVN
ncbi:hypothetical protein NE619_00870 [Anaerovorax odorimutans]|uniref:Polysaccharide biosynthesis protein n=1 Tax=Anaerovorax odorimutans TaxID=109327 RepID=A0ABT1RJD3_9FIRM|nr:hypothetical protein [Anaerovorax odorimutans]MCQ4635283.1 hypothetical protein [Anaerovorax odorimutans]